jgi:hypothetical protein
MKKIPSIFIVIAAIIMMGAYNPSIVAGVKATATLDFPSTATNDCSDLNMTVTGAIVGKPVSLGVGLAAIPNDGVFDAYVTSTNNVLVRFCNNTILSIDPGSATFEVVVIQ